MIRLVVSWKGNPERSEEECDEHYRTIHTEMGRAIFDTAPGCIGYVQGKVKRKVVHDYNAITPREVEKDIDWIMEVFFTDRASLDAVYATPEIAATFEDHHNFMQVDVPASITIYEVDERIVVDRGLSKRPAMSRGAV